MIIGITGTDGAGKGAIVDYLVSKKGFVHYSSRALIEQECKNNKIESSRANLRLMGNQLRATHGNDFLVSNYVEIMHTTGVKNAVVESIRAVDEVVALKKHGGFLLAVDAKQSIRFSRIKGRKSSSDQVSFKEFVAQETLEMYDPDPHGMQKNKVINMADFTIQNNGSFKEMGIQIETFLSTYHD